MKRWLDALAGDARYTFRQMVRAPVFTLVTIAILAIGIGANSALFSFIDVLVLRPAPGMTDADQLVEISHGAKYGGMTQSSYDIIHDRQTVFEGVAAYWEAYSATVDVNGTRTRENSIGIVNPEYYTTMKPMMAAGHAPSASDAAANPRGLVIGYGYATSTMGSAADAIGKTIRINGEPMTVVGVLGPDYSRPDRIVIGIGGLGIVYREEMIQYRREAWSELLFLAGRLKPGATVASARAQVLALVQQLSDGKRHEERAFPREVTSLRATPRAALKELKGPLGLIGNVTTFILLIASANVGVLLLSRSVARRREIAVRFALGAERRRLIRQLVTEGVILSMMAGAGGLMFLTWLNTGIQRVFFPTTTLSLKPSWHTVVATLLFAVVTGLLFALAPALHVTQATASDVLKAGAGTGDRKSTRLQRTFVVAEVALSMALVCATGIFLDAALRATKRTMSYMTSPKTIAVYIQHNKSERLPNERKLRDLNEMIRKVSAVKGVQTASFTEMLPGIGGCCMVDIFGAGYIGMRNTPPDAKAEGLRRSTLSMPVVGPNLFATLGVPLLSGRDIAPTDVAGTERVVVIDEVVARNKFKGENPLGKMLSVRPWYSTKGDSGTIMLRVIGVAPMLPEDGSRGYTPTIYVPAAQHDRGLYSSTFVVRSSGRSAAILIPEVTRALRSAASDVPVSDVKTFAQSHRELHRNVYNAAMIAGASGLIALLLACVGLYATISYGLSQRVREIGVRRALGANDRDVVYAFFEDGMRMSLIGFAIGIPMALAAMKIGVAEKFGVQTLTTSSIATVMAVLLTVCALASWLPARRAAKVDALTALKQD